MKILIIHVLKSELCWHFKSQLCVFFVASKLCDLAKKCLGENENARL